MSLFSWRHHFHVCAISEIYMWWKGEIMFQTWAFERKFWTRLKYSEIKIIHPTSLMESISKMLSKMRQKKQTEE